MGTYVITGGATGIGAALREQLRKRGDKVVVVDIHQADIIADLSTAQGRENAALGVKSAAAEGLDGLVLCAGLGAHVSPSSRIIQVNYFGVTEVVQAVREQVAKNKGSIVVISSNSAPMPHVHRPLIESMLAGNEQQSADIADRVDGNIAYASSKNAITQWMRRQAPVLIKEGIRMNAVAPGITQTPLLDQAVSKPVIAKAIKNFADTVPMGRIGQPDQIADAVRFLMSPEAAFVCGAVLFVDGGHDALARPDRF